MSDPTEVNPGGEFAEALRMAVFGKEKIIETGTFKGKGTTQIIAGVTSGTFFSIEADRDNFFEAVKNLQGESVIPMLGLSLHIQSLPELPEIEKSCDEARSAGVYVDHPKGEEFRYLQESRSMGGHDLLNLAMMAFDYEPDLIMLDSAGHLGFIEFSQVINRLKGPCIIALDDTNHLKHYRSLAVMKSHPRFKMISQGDEKFGYAIAEFTP